MFSPWYSWKITHLALSKNHSLITIKYYLVNRKTILLQANNKDRYFIITFSFTDKGKEKKKRKSMKEEFEDEIPRKKKKKGQPLYVNTKILIPISLQTVVIFQKVHVDMQILKIWFSGYFNNPFQNKDSLW